MGEGGLDTLFRSAGGGPAALLVALGLAFFLGAAHALTPGHGKTLVAAYLVGTRGTVRDAFVLGATVTVTHTLTVFLLGLAVLYASFHVNLNRISLQLEVASAVLITAIGVWLLYRRLGLGAHGHEHHHPHGHEHHHHHGEHHHPHTPSRPGLASLLSLGISGGLVPCPEALALLILSVSAQQVGFGLVLLAVFSFGLAAVLIAIGSAMVLAGPAMTRLAPGEKLARWLPVAGAFVVAALGVVMLANSVQKL
jgi:ABC-type nickel/cobalt efflux system permease component RcnA